jgi:HAD superfamily hydrolase (TIGR01509 family)
MKKAVIFDMYGVLLLRTFLREHEHLLMTRVVEDLKQRGCKLFLLSNIYVRNSSYFKKKYPFLAHFDKLYFSSDTRFNKPDPRAYEQVLKENDLKPEDCIFFDDTSRNVEAARALGIDAHVFKSPEEVRTLLGI